MTGFILEKGLILGRLKNVGKFSVFELVDLIRKMILNKELYVNSIHELKIKS